MINRMLRATEQIGSYLTGKEAYTNLSITVHQSQETFFFTQSKTTCVVQPCTLNLTTTDGKKSKSVTLYNFKNTEPRLFESLNESSDINFYLEKSKTTTKLPQHMTEHFVNFLKHGEPQGKSLYCCINFSYELVFGRRVIPFDNEVNYYQHHGNTTLQGEANPGTAIHLYEALNNQQINHHFAISLGSNYYLSMTGIHGPILICDLDEMKKLYKSTMCYEIRQVSDIKAVTDDFLRRYDTVNPKSAAYIEGIELIKKNKLRKDCLHYGKLMGTASLAVGVAFFSQKFLTQNMPDENDSSIKFLI